MGILGLGTLAVCFMSQIILTAYVPWGLLHHVPDPKRARDLSVSDTGRSIDRDVLSPKFLESKYRV